MSVPDPLIIKYLTLLTDVEESTVQQRARQLETKRVNPRDVKLQMAEALVALYHGVQAARQAREEFLKVFSRRQMPSAMKTVQVAPVAGSDEVNVVELLVGEGLVKTKNEARRLLRQGGVKLDGTPLRSVSVKLGEAGGAVLQVGSRRFIRLNFAKRG